MPKNAFEIAKKSLKECYEKNGIIAGKVHYANHWARDSFYASWGALELGDFEIVKKNLELFLKYMKRGQVPLRIGSSYLGGFLAFIGIKPWFGVRYNQGKGLLNSAMDPNLLFLMTIEKYVRETGDLAFARKNITKIKSAIAWLNKWKKDDLIYSEKYATWQDSIKKKGFVLYTNILYYETMKKMGRLFTRLRIKNEFTEKANEIKKMINRRFWDKRMGHYIDYYNEKKRSGVFTSDGNFYSILFDVADKAQSESILKKAKKYGISKDVPSYTNFPKHKNRDVYPLLYLGHMQSYNDYGIAWPWIGCIHAVCLFKMKRVAEAMKIMKKISKLIEKDGDVYETYEKNGKPLNRLFYRSEHPFAWGAGFYILAYKQLKNYGKI
ncbi:hypothetical protein J4411_02980 [Candidatus Pacearchaeota archaeon]|nr:hypothetical protein [Candidatus Pacearchaeota archaeon]